MRLFSRTLRYVMVLPFVLTVEVACGWPGVDVKPLRKERSDLAPGQGGTYYQLSDSERKELVWMAKAANAAYPGIAKPLGYRSFSKMEWDECAVGCEEVVYTTDGYFNVGSGLRGRLMVNMLNEGRVVIALSGCDFEQGMKEGFKDGARAALHYLSAATNGQYEEALRVMNGVLGVKPRSDLWIVGHSLGGSLATYLAMNLPESKCNVKCATFNGFGLSPRFKASAEGEDLAAKRIRNVFCDGDPIYNNYISPNARHFGPAYSLKGEGGWIAQHSLDDMLKLMVKHRTKWFGL